MVRMIIILVPLLEVLWFAWAWWRVRKFPGKAVWRGALSAFFVLMVSHFIWMMLHRRAHASVGAPPLTLGMAYIWHLLVLPLISFLILTAETGLAGFRGSRYVVRHLKQTTSELDSPYDDSPPLDNRPAAPALSRRQFLTMAAVATPPLFTIAAGIGGYRQTQGFMIRPMEFDVPGLPKELDGLTIAHLSDMHAGKFSDEKLLRRIVDATNDLRSDVVLVTGDLIDFSLNDLPGATDALRRIDAPAGLHMCEGNHDLFESREEFENGVRDSGLNILINQTENLRLRGRDVQIHGLRWGSEESSRGHRQEGGAGPNIEAIRPNIDPDAFSIMLAHHPHAFDFAADAGIPLVLSGHTHGGQFMLTDDIGAGPLMFKYWSGLYKKPNSRLVVSNGVGNWLPLRINAPAEILHLTLKSVQA